MRRRGQEVAVLVLVALVLLASGCAGLPGEARSVAGGGGELPPPVRQVLPNGLRLVVQDHRASDIVALYLWVGVGVRYDKPDELGYSHFMEHMLFKGTDTWGPGYLDRAVEGVGGRSNAVTSFDYTTFYLVLPREALETGVQLLADMAFRSVVDTPCGRMPSTGLKPTPAPGRLRSPTS